MIWTGAVVKEITALITVIVQTFIVDATPTKVHPTLTGKLRQYKYVFPVF